MSLLKKYIAEFFGTFVLVLFGCGAAAISGVSGVGPSGIGLLGISLAFGLAVVAMAYTIGPFSGCHITPAISIAMLVAGKLSIKDTIGYIVSQCIGAIAGAGVLYALVSGGTGFNMPEWGLGSNGWGEGYLGAYNMQAALIAEFVFTFLFLMVIFGVTAKKASPQMAGFRTSSICRGNGVKPIMVVYNSSNSRRCVCSFNKKNDDRRLSNVCFIINLKPVIF